MGTEKVPLSAGIVSITVKKKTRHYNEDGIKKKLDKDNPDLPLSIHQKTLSTKIDIPTNLQEEYIKTKNPEAGLKRKLKPPGHYFKEPRLSSA